MEAHKEIFFEAAEIWVETDKLEKITDFPFKRATIKSLDITKSTAEVKYLNGSTEQIQISKLTRFYPLDNINIDDVSELSSINVVDLLQNLKNRFQIQQIFTNVGKTLIIINPYQPIQGMFSSERIEEFIEESKSKSLLGYDRYKKLPPHVYQITMSAIDELINHKKSQAMVISGESGAGKTETAKQAMKFITYYFARQNSQRNQTNSSNSIVSESLEVKILSCNPVLETFGNSKTLRNDNSSRFGKYIKIFLNVSTMNIIGAHMETYLLEKSRVCKISQGERNYHIFYQLIKSINLLLENEFDLAVISKKNENVAKKLQNKKLSQFIEDYFNKEFIIYYLGILKFCQADGKVDLLKFNYLRSDNVSLKEYDINNVDDVANFFETLESLIKTGFNYEQILRIIQLVLAILLIGNIEFLDNTEGNNQKQCLLSDTSKHYLEKAALLLDVNNKSLYNAFTYNIRVINNETIFTPLKVSDCLTFRDTFAKEIYNRLFNFLVTKMNTSLSMQGENESVEDHDEILHIGILDIFGFECFNVNSLEQFCINYSNERLHQLYIAEIFKETENLFREENLSEFYSKINFQDNSPVIELMDKRPNGIFLLLDNECSLTADDNGFFNKVSNTHKTHPLIKKSRTDDKRFIINHTAKDVEYLSNGFVGKNLDEFKQSMSDCLKGIGDEKIIEILNSLDNSQNNPVVSRHNSSSSTSHKKEKFLGSKFRNDMNNLIDELKRCNCHYIRCLKPNEEKRASFFVSNQVMQQIKYLGILDTIRVRKQGYPVKLNFFLFYKRYEDVAHFESKPLITEVKENYKKEILRIMCKKVFEILYSSDKNQKNYPSETLTSHILFGKNFVFIKQPFYEYLDKLRSVLIADKERSVTKIALNFRNRKCRMEFLKMKQKVIRIQKYIRLRKDMKYIRTLKFIVRKVKSIYRKHKLKKKMNSLFKLVKSVKIFISNLIFRYRLETFMKKVRRLENVFYIFNYKLKIIKYKNLKSLLLEMISNSIEISFRYRVINKVAKIQNIYRGYKVKQKLGESYEKVKTKIKEIKILKSLHKLQKNFRMFQVKNYLDNLRFISDKVKGLFLIRDYRLYFVTLKNNSVKIQKNFRIFIYRKNILNQRWNEFNELIEYLYNESKIMNEINLFPLFLNHLKNLKEKSKLSENFKILEKIYNTKLLNTQPELYLNTSFLKISPYDEPKLQFFAYILDFDAVIDTDEIYTRGWGEIAKEIMKYCVKHNSPVQSIEVGSMHSLFMNSQGKVFAWGWNGQGQCGFKIDKDKDFHIFVENEIQNQKLRRASSKQGQIESEFKEGSIGRTLNLTGRDNSDNYDCENLQDACENFSVEKERKMQLANDINNGFNDISDISDVPKFKNSSLEDFYALDSPVLIEIENFVGKKIIAGDSFSFVISKDDKVSVFGDNKYNNLGINYHNQSKENSNKNNIYNPTNLIECLKMHHKSGRFTLSQSDMKNLKIVDAKTAGKSNLLLTDKGEVIILSHQSTNGKLIPHPRQIIIPGGIIISQIECGKNFSILLSNTGVVYSFGNNSHGQLGISDGKSRSYPEEIKYLREIGIKASQISCGFKHVVLRASNNKIYTWGCNTNGQLGIGSYKSSSTPNILEIPHANLKLNNIIYVSAGLRSTAFLTENRQIFHCGTNGDITNQNIPAIFDYMAKIPEIFSYDNHQIVKIHHTWSNSMSVLYSVVAEVGPLKAKLKNPQKLKSILNSLTNKWVCKSIYPPWIEHVNEHIASKHSDILGKTGSSNTASSGVKTKKKVK